MSHKTIRTTSIPKIKKIHSGVWKFKAKNRQNCQFWPKNGQILAISEFSQHIYYDFLRDDHKDNFHTNKTQYYWFPGKSQNSKKLKKICNYFWKIEAKNSQKGWNLVKNGQILSIFEFPRHAEYDFSKKTIGTTSTPKIRKINGRVWKLLVKNSQNCQFCPKNGRILVLNDQNFAISEYDFLKEDHKNNFHTNKTQYDWFPGMSQNSKKFHTKN